MDLIIHYLVVVTKENLKFGFCPACSAALWSSERAFCSTMKHVA